MDTITFISLFISGAALAWAIDETRRKRKAQLRLAVRLVDLKEAESRIKTAEADADRLASIVDEFITVAVNFSKHMGDNESPTLKKEREALRLHNEALELRHEKPNDY